MATAYISARSHAYCAQSARCFYCGIEMWTESPKPFAARYGLSMADARRFQLTAEHLIARSEGGGNSRENIVAACLFCNQKRHQRKAPPAPQAYRALVQKRVAKGKWHPAHVLARVLHAG